MFLAFLADPQPEQTTGEVIVVSIAASIAARNLAGMVGPGNGFYAFNSLPPELLAAEQKAGDFAGATICASSRTANQQAIDDALLSPPPVGQEPGSKLWDMANPPA